MARALAMITSHDHVKKHLLPQHRYRDARRKMLNMPGIPVGTTKRAHGEPTDSNETIPDGGHGLVRARWQELSVSVGLLQPLHRSRDALLNLCIMKIKGILARHGIPKQVFSDNGPQFFCKKIAQFANTWGFVHVTFSPRYPQSNGLAEKAVHTTNRTIMIGNSIRSRSLRRSTGVPYVILFFCLYQHLVFTSKCFEVGTMLVSTRQRP